MIPVHFVCDSFPYLHGSAEVAQVSVGEKTFPVLLDTGANPSVLNWSVAEAAGISRAGAHRLNENTKGIDTSKVGTTTHVGMIKGARLGQVPLDSAQVRISNLSWFSEDGFQALIGNDLLAGGLLIRADSADHRRQYVCRPPS